MSVLPHVQIVAKLDEARKTFPVRFIKTYPMLPSTARFLQLDCACWGADAERRLRQAMAR